MNEDICKRDKSGVDWSNKDLPVISLNAICNKPKNPEFIYCESCMREVFDENANTLPK